MPISMLKYIKIYKNLPTYFASMTCHYAWRARRPQLIQRQQTIRHTSCVR